VRYVTQGACGQLGLWSDARDLGEVIDDPATPRDRAALLAEVPRIKRWGQLHGLRISGNYEQYVERRGDYVVWFVNASDPLAFVPKTFWFPVVGSFPGLSWFDEDEARQFSRDLSAEGYDVSVRGVTAFSTGGWFDDPVVWTMIDDRDDAHGALTNVVLHESLHATVFVSGQQYFNESLASFVADGMTPRYLSERFGADSVELQAYEAKRAEYERALEVLGDAYRELDALYASPLPDAEKLRLKRRLLDSVQSRLQLDPPPNNATLIGFQLYRVGTPELTDLLSVCDDRWDRFLAAIGSLRPQDFAEEQQPDFGAVVDGLRRRRCEPYPRRVPPGRVVGKQERMRRKQERSRETARELRDAQRSLDGVEPR